MEIGDVSRGMHGNGRLWDEAGWSKDYARDEMALFKDVNQRCKPEMKTVWVQSTSGTSRKGVLDKYAQKDAHR